LKLKVIFVTDVVSVGVTVGVNVGVGVVVPDGVS
jgi:hypothetical protein